MDKTSRRILLWLGLLPIITAVLYLIGRVHADSFLGAFGLSSDQFPSSFEGSVFTGSLNIVVAGLTPAMYLIVVLTVVAVGILVVVVWWHLRARSSRRRKLTWREEPKPPDERAIRMLSLSERTLNVGMVLLVVIVFVVAILLLAARGGTAAAQRFKKRAADHRQPQVTLTLKEPRDQYTGALIACNAIQCAYWIENHSEIFNLSDVARFRAEPVHK